MKPFHISALSSSYLPSHSVPSSVSVYIIYCLFKNINNISLCCYVCQCFNKYLDQNIREYMYFRTSDSVTSMKSTHFKWFGCETLVYTENQCSQCSAASWSSALLFHDIIGSFFNISIKLWEQLAIFEGNFSDLWMAPSSQIIIGRFIRWLNCVWYIVKFSINKLICKHCFPWL